MESVDAYAELHGVTKAEARAQLQADSIRRGIEEHAAKYGISEDEAKRQLEYAASQQLGE
jgi:hypothetical protein